MILSLNWNINYRWRALLLMSKPGLDMFFNGGFDQYAKIILFRDKVTDKETILTRCF